VSVKAPVQTERQFERAVVEYAQLRGWLAWHAYDSRKSTPGWPDLAFARKGRLVLAELKSENGRVSTAQRRWLEALGIEDEHVRRHALHPIRGFEWRVPRLMVCLWRPADWPEIEEILC
jgi:VRR-NUC domain-containing protein